MGVGDKSCLIRKSSKKLMKTMRCQENRFADVGRLSICNKIIITVTSDNMDDEFMK